MPDDADAKKILELLPSFSLCWTNGGDYWDVLVERD